MYNLYTYMYIIIEYYFIKTHSTITNKFNTAEKYTFIILTYAFNRNLITLTGDRITLLLLCECIG